MTTQTGHDSLKTRQTLKVGNKNYDYFSLKTAEKTLGDISRLPYSLKVLLENLLRYEDGRSVTVDDIKACGAWLKTKTSDAEVAYRPSRVLMQDFTGVPAVVDLAAMRDAMTKLGGDPQKINPLVPVDLVIDHSVIVDAFGTKDAFKTNVDLEYQDEAGFLQAGCGRGGGWYARGGRSVRGGAPRGPGPKFYLQHLEWTELLWRERRGGCGAPTPFAVGNDLLCTLLR